MTKKWNIILIILTLITLISLIFISLFFTTKFEITKISGSGEVIVKNFNIEDQILEKDKGEIILKGMFTVYGRQDPGCERNINYFMSRYFTYGIILIDNKFVNTLSGFNAYRCGTYDEIFDINISGLTLGKHKLEVKFVGSNAWINGPGWPTNMLAENLIELQSCGYATVNYVDEYVFREGYTKRIINYQIYYDKINNDLLNNTFCSGQKSNYNLFSLKKDFVICENDVCELKKEIIVINETHYVCPDGLIVNNPDLCALPGEKIKYICPDKSVAEDPSQCAFQPPEIIVVNNSAFVCPDGSIVDNVSKCNITRNPIYVCPDKIIVNDPSECKITVANKFLILLIFGGLLLLISLFLFVFFLVTKAKS